MHMHSNALFKSIQDLINLIFIGHPSQKFEKYQYVGQQLCDTKINVNFNHLKQTEVMTARYIIHSFKTQSISFTDCFTM